MSNIGAYKGFRTYVSEAKNRLKSLILWCLPPPLSLHRKFRRGGIVASYLTYLIISGVVVISYDNCHFFV